MLAYFVCYESAVLAWIAVGIIWASAVYQIIKTVRLVLYWRARRKAVDASFARMDKWLDEAQLLRGHLFLLLEAFESVSANEKRQARAHQLLKLIEAQVKKIDAHDAAEPPPTTDVIREWEKKRHG